MPESSTRVVVNAEVRRLDEESPLVRGMQEAQEVQWRFGVCRWSTFRLWPEP